MSRSSILTIAALFYLSIIGLAFADNQIQSGSGPGNCKVIERQPDAGPTGNLSTSVQAGNGQVSAQSTGGNGVTVHSGNGGTSSSVATTTTGSGGSQTVVTASDGTCTIYVNPAEKKE